MIKPSCSFVVFATLTILHISSIVMAQDKNVLLDPKDIKLEEKKVINSEAKAAVKEYGEDWWSIDIKFSTEAEITEEIQVKVYLAAYDYLNNDTFVILTAEETFMNVLEGKEHRATFYLHPGSAVRYGGEKGLESFGKTSGEHNVHVEIFEKGVPVAEMDMKEDDPNWFRQGSPVPGVLLGVKDSPWWPYEALAYSQIKEKR